MKKTIALALALLLCFSVFAQGASEAKTDTPALKVGMVTDSGTIDDRSFNQGTFEGVKKAAEEFGLECTYLRPSGTTTTDYVTAITDLYDAGYRFVACFALHSGQLFSSPSNISFLQYGHIPIDL